MKHLGKLALLGAVLAASAQFASATEAGTTIASGQSSNLSISNVAATTYTSGTLYTLGPNSDSGTFTAAGIDYVASYSESVYVGGTGAACATCLDFVYTVTDTSGDTLTSSAVSNFTGFATNVGYVTSTGGATGATTALDNTGTAITFNFTGGLAAGQSATFVVFSNAYYDTGANITSQDAVAGNSPDLGPSNATPEPSSLLLLGTGLLGTAGILVRKRQTA